MKKTTYIEIDYSELETIVKKAYDITNYEFVAVEECGNNSSHTFRVTKQKPLGIYSTKKLEEFVKSNGQTPNVNYQIFQDLVNKGVLEPGEYLVNVSW